VRKRAKRTRCSLGALSRLEISGRAHDVRSSGSRQNTRLRNSVSKKTSHGTVLEYSAQMVDGYGVKVSKTADTRKGGMLADGCDESDNSLLE
jgi:hypothetical protein